MKIKNTFSCTEIWDEMNPEAGGRFCSSCQRTVIDFTQYSDQELAGFFKSHANEKICARMRKSQLDRELIKKQKFPVLQFPGKAAALLVAGMALAQQSFSQQTSVSDIKTEQVGLLNENENNPPQFPDTNRKTVFGRLIDTKTKKAVTFASVNIPVANITIKCDDQGKFLVDLPASFMADSFILFGSAPEYLSNEIIEKLY